MAERMKRAELEAAIGKRVYTVHAGVKMIDRGPEHGPYQLLKITKGGRVMLQGYDFSDVAPRHITRIHVQPADESFSSSAGYGGWGHDE